MDIKSMLQGLSQGDDKKKKRIIIALIILFLLSLIGGTVYLLVASRAPANNGEVLSDFEGMAPRGGVATSSLKRLPFIDLAADHPTVAPGQESKISWVVSNATACVDGNGDALDLTGSLSISPTEPYTFDVLCTGPNGTQSQTITIGVSTAPIIELIATPTAVLSGKQSYISWNTINADRCEDSKGATLRLTGGFSIKPTTPYTYSMSCTGPKGTTKKSVTVKIASPFAANGDGSTGGSTGNNNGNNGTSSESSFGTDIGDTSGIGAPAPTDSNLAGKSFVVELTATPNPVPFDTTTKITWKVVNLGTAGRCTILTSNNTGTPYLPIGSFSGASLSRTVTSHRMTSDETITLACTKGSEEIVKTLTLAVGKAPPTPDPEITSFSVVVKAAPSRNYASTGSVLVARWKTNPASKIDKCGLWRSNGSTNTFIKAVPTQSPAAMAGSLPFEFTERTPGNNTYALECTRGAGEEEKIITMTSTTPDHITMINCTFVKGFGGDLDTIKELTAGEVLLDTFTAGGTRTPTLEPVCVYTIGKPQGLGVDFKNLWNLPIGISDDVPGTKTPGGGSFGDNGSKNYLCAYTNYTVRSDGNGGIISGNWTNNAVQTDPSGAPSHGGYHKNWTYLSHTAQTHPRGGAWIDYLYFDATGIHRVRWDEDRGAGYDQTVQYNERWLNSITCLVK